MRWKRCSSSHSQKPSTSISSPTDSVREASVRDALEGTGCSSAGIEATTTPLPDSTVLSARSRPPKVGSESECSSASLGSVSHAGSVTGAVPVNCSTSAATSSTSCGRLVTTSSGPGHSSANAAAASDRADPHAPSTAPPPPDFSAATTAANSSSRSSKPGRSLSDSAMWLGA